MVESRYLESSSRVFEIKAKGGHWVVGTVRRRQTEPKVTEDKQGTRSRGERETDKDQRQVQCRQSALLSNVLTTRRKLNRWMTRTSSNYHPPKICRIRLTFQRNRIDRFRGTGRSTNIDHDTHERIRIPVSVHRRPRTKITTFQLNMRCVDK